MGARLVGAAEDQFSTLLLHLGAQSAHFGTSFWHLGAGRVADIHGSYNVLYDL